MSQLFTADELNDIMHQRLVGLVKNYPWYKDDLSENIDDLSHQKEELAA